MSGRRCIRLAKEGAWIIIGQVASVLGSLVLVRVLTEHLEPAQYGQLALGLTVAGMVNQVVMGGVSAGIGRYYSIAAERKDLHRYLHASRRLMGYATFAAMIIGLVLMVGLLWLGYSKWMGLAASALLFAVLGGYNATLSGIQNAARQREIVAFHIGLDAWLKILFAVGVMLWLGNSSEAVVIGYAISSLVVSGSQFIFLRRLIPHKRTGGGGAAHWTGEMWAYSWPFSTWGIFSWAQQSSDRWALETFTATHEVGLYSVLFQLGYSPISMAIGMVVSFLGPILYQRSGDATDSARNTNVRRLTLRITRISLFVTLIGFVFAFGVHRWLFTLLVTSKYQSVSYLLPWVLLAGGLFASGQILALKMMSDMNSAAMALPKIVTALLGILFNFYLASLAGVTGVVAGLVAFSVIFFTWMFLLAFRSPMQIETISEPQ